MLNEKMLSEDQEYFQVYSKIISERELFELRKWWYEWSRRQFVNDGLS